MPSVYLVLFVDGLLAAGVALLLVLFGSLKAEIHVLRRRVDSVEAASEATEAMRREIAELRKRIAETAVAPAPALPRGGLDGGKRTQVLRMYRRGDSAVTISGALGIPRSEVELLLKVHSLAVAG